jgi:tetratricopeptide (TPR) repeat protein
MAAWAFFNPYSAYLARNEPHPMLKYPARHYDDQLSLKIPIFLWLALIYGVRHFFLIAATKLMPLETLQIPWIYLQAHMQLISCDLPVLLVLLATGHRIPSAIRLMRWLWLNGKSILAMSYLLSLSGFIYLNFDTLSTPNAEEWFFTALIVMTDMAVLIWLMRSSLVSDIFAEFPDRLDDKSQNKLPKTVSSERLMLLKMQHEKQLALLDIAVWPHLPSVAFEITPRTTPQNGLEAAAGFEAKSQIPEAEAVYRALLANWPDCADAWHGFGLLAYQADKREHGIALVEEAMRLDGKSAIYRRNIGEMYRRIGKVEQAIHFGQLACRLCPEDAEAWHYQGLALTNAQRFEEAITAYRKVLTLEPKHVQCWNNLGVALQAAGKTVEAKKAYKQALIFNPSYIEAQQNLQQLSPS